MKFSQAQLTNASQYRELLELHKKTIKSQVLWLILCYNPALTEYNLALQWVFHENVPLACLQEIT